MGNAITCFDKGQNGAPPLGGPAVSTAADFRASLGAAKGYHEVMEVVKMVTDTGDTGIKLKLVSGDWQLAMRRAGPHADSVLRLVEGSVYESQLDESCYHLVVISLVQIAMKTPSSDTSARLLEDALGVILTMEQRNINQGVHIAYRAVVHAAGVTSCPEIVEHAGRLQQQFAAAISSIPDEHPQQQAVLASDAHVPPDKLNLDQMHFSQSAPPMSMYDALQNEQPIPGMAPMDEDEAAWVRPEWVPPEEAYWADPDEADQPQVGMISDVGETRGEASRLSPQLNARVADMLNGSPEAHLADRIDPEIRSISAGMPAVPILNTVR